MDNINFRSKEKLYRCYFELTLDLIGGKWKPKIPPKVEYSLTEQGKSLIPLLNQLKDWGEEYFNDNIELFDHKTLELEEELYSVFGMHNKDRSCFSFMDWYNSINKNIELLKEDKNEIYRNDL